MSNLFIACIAWGGSIAFVLLIGIDATILFVFIAITILLVGSSADSLSTLLCARIIEIRTFCKIEENFLLVEKVKKFGVNKGMLLSQFDTERLLGYLMFFAIFLLLNWGFVYIYNPSSVTLDYAIRISLLPFVAVGFMKALAAAGNLVFICLYALASEELRDKVLDDD